MMTRHWLPVAVVLLAVALPCAAQEAGPDPSTDKRQAKREAIDAMAEEALAAVLEGSERAREFADASVAYAVFDNFKVAFLLSGGGGVGVAVDKATGERTYMKMGQAGLGLGLGGQSYQVVFFFETPDAYQRFVNAGWQANTEAHAAAGTAGVNAGASFHEGVAIVQVTNKGLMADADVTGTRYWKDKKLN